MKTDGQKKVSDELTELVNRIEQEFEHPNSDEHGLVTGHLLIYTTTIFDDDGDRSSSVSWVCSDMPTHEMLGLLEFTKQRLIAHTNALCDSDE